MKIGRFLNGISLPVLRNIDLALLAKSGIAFIHIPVMNVKMHVVVDWKQKNSQ